MIVTKLEEVLLKTSEVTGYPKEQVASVIAQFFKVLHEFTMHPTHAGFRIPTIGCIRTSSRLLRWYLPNVILKRYKEGKITKERASAYWKLRDLTRKDEARRNFKKRFNLEFKPHWRQDSDSVEGDSGSHDD